MSAPPTSMFVDDALLLHDAAFPTLGVPEIVVMAAYGALAATAVWQARAWLTASPVRPWTALAAALFAVSVLADLIDWRSWGDDLLFAVEDGSKFVAIALWVDIALWCAITAARPRTDGARGGT